MTAAPSLAAPGEGEVVPVGADAGRMLAVGQAVDVIEMTFHAGGEPPLHLHRNEDEWFYVLEGSVAFFVAHARVEGGPGTFAYAPREVPHTYAVRSGTARVLIGSDSANFSRMFAALAELGAEATPKRFGAALDGFGIVMLGPNPGHA